MSIKLKYCPNCDLPIRVIKREPVYDFRTGIIDYYNLTLACTRPLWKGGRHGIWQSTEKATDLSSELQSLRKLAQSTPGITEDRK